MRLVVAQYTHDEGVGSTCLSLYRRGLLLINAMNVLINSDLSNVSSWGSAELFDRLCAVVDTATNQSSVAGSLQIMERLRQVTIIILYDIQHSRDCI